MGSGWNTNIANLDEAQNAPFLEDFRNFLKNLIQLSDFQFSWAFAILLSGNTLENLAIRYIYKFIWWTGLNFAELDITKTTTTILWGRHLKMLMNSLTASPVVKQYMGRWHLYLLKKGLTRMKENISNVVPLCNCNVLWRGCYPLKVNLFC